MRTPTITASTPLTQREREAMQRLRAQGPLVVGQNVILNSSKAMHLRRSQVLTSVARGLQLRGLVALERMPRGPLVMTLPKGSQ